MTDRDQAYDRDEAVGEWRAQEGSPSPADDEYWQDERLARLAAWDVELTPDELRQLREEKDEETSDREADRGGSSD